MQTILVTGGCGFIGHHFVEHVMRKTNWNIIVLDKLTYDSFVLYRLRDNCALENQRVKVLPYYFSIPISVGIKK